MTTRRRLVAAVSSTTLAATALTTITAGGAAADPEPGTAPFTLTAPDSAVARSYGRRAYVDLGVQMLAGSSPFEVRSQRASYDDPITTTWTAGEQSGTLPIGTQSTFRSLPGFLELTFSTPKGRVVLGKATGVCVNGETQRTRPDADPRSPYPWGCPYNPFTLGSVQGIQAGWSTSAMGYGRPVRLAAGTYDVSIDVADVYADAFGLDDASRHHEMSLVIKPERDRGLPVPHSAGRGAGRGDAHSAVASPAARPQGTSGGVSAEADGPRPDLRSLPAFDIELNNAGSQLRFSANVWNGGDSPLVIDGFRSADEDEMDAYQYFFDSEGNQIGYEQLDSHFHWHAANHRHWHFEDFGRYRLLNLDKTPVRTSGKVSFCLANTDAVDYTVPGADWQPDNTDLSTSCGQYGSLSIREVLSSGSGDTYSQYRKGQALAVKNVPNGRYLLAVEANPFGKLVESDTTNNDAFREIRLHGTGENRQVEVSQVGLIDDLGGGRR